MDTINVTYTLIGELSNEDILELKNRRYIESIKLNDTKSNTYHIGYSVPKFFDNTNAYLVNNSDFEQFKKMALNIFKSITIITATVTRVDTPFTFIMKEGETFNEYSHVFRLLSYFYSHSVDGSTKYYADTLTEKRESFILGNKSNLNKSTKKIIIYDQDKKISNIDTTPSKSIYTQIRRDHPNLYKRIRVEVSRKTNIALRYLEYTVEYTNAYKELTRTLLDKELIELCLKTLKEEYNNNLSKDIDLYSAIFNGLVFDYDTYRSSLKGITKNAKTLESQVTRMRKKLDKLDRSHMYNITLKKILPRMKREFKEQITW